MDSTGVIPLPPTTAAKRPALGSRTKRPAGAITSTVSPTASSLSAYVENSPPSTRRTPTRSDRGPSGSVTGAQIEYVRRTSASSTNSRTATCWPGA